MIAHKNITHILTARELIFAADNKIPVWFENRFFNPMDSSKNFNGKTLLEEAKVGYYIGNTDIDIEVFEPHEKVDLDSGESQFTVYGLINYKYE